MNPRRTVTGVIKGSTDGIRVGFIGSLTNHAVAVIEDKGDAEVVLTRTSGGTATVTNSGRIEGTTFGLDYGVHTIRQLINNGTGEIQGGTERGFERKRLPGLTTEVRLSPRTMTAFGARGR